MYENYWQLDRRPFENSDDAPFYYPGESHQGTLLKLRYVVENRRGGAILAGSPGTGKTLVARMLTRQLAESCQPLVHLVFPQMAAPELLAYLADELAAPGGTGHGIDQTIRRIRNFLDENEARGQHAVVAIDEAHLLEATDTLEALRLLLNFEVNARPALTLLLIGQPRLLPMVDRMPGLEERLALKCLLRPFTLDETISYIAHRLQAAGAKRQIFEPAAIEAIFGLTHGLARRINRLCDLALLIGFAEERPAITAAQVELGFARIGHRRTGIATGSKKPRGRESISPLRASNCQTSLERHRLPTPFAVDSVLRPVPLRRRDFSSTIGRDPIDRCRPAGLTCPPPAACGIRASGRWPSSFARPEPAIWRWEGGFRTAGP